MRFVEKSGTWNVTVGGRSDTPILELPNLTRGNMVSVTATFQAKTNGGEGKGFTFKIQPTNPNDAKAISASDCIVEGNVGFQSTSRTAFFETVVNSPTGVEDVDFEVIFEKGDLDGVGTIRNFLMVAGVVTLEQ